MLWYACHPAVIVRFFKDNCMVITQDCPAIVGQSCPRVLFTWSLFHRRAALLSAERGAAAGKEAGCGVQFGDISADHATLADVNASMRACMNETCF
jgi:hypothetical protein